MEEYDLICSDETFKVNNKNFNLNNNKVMMKKLSIFVTIFAFLFILFWSVFSINRIDSGQTGIMVNLAGSERGIDDAEVKTGWVVYNRFIKELYEYPSFAQIVDYETFEIQDKKGTIFYADPTVEYYIERDNAKTVFLRYRKEIKELEKTAILSEVKNAYKDMSGVYETDSLINNRPQFEKEVEALLKKRLAEKGFTLSNIQSSVKPNEVLQNSVDEKNISVQRSLKAKNELEATKAEAEKKVVQAKAEAEANRILQQSITPMMIQKMLIEKWDGTMPKVVGSDNIMNMLDIK